MVGLAGGVFCWDSRDSGNGAVRLVASPCTSAGARWSVERSGGFMLVRETNRQLCLSAQAANSLLVGATDMRLACLAIAAWHMAT